MYTTKKLVDVILGDQESVIIITSSRSGTEA